MGSSVPVGPRWFDVTPLAHGLLGSILPQFSAPTSSLADLLDDACVTLRESCTPKGELFESCKVIVDLDAESIFRGDPAARSKDEVVIAYPGFYAVAIHRFSHELWKEGFFLLARVLSEHAHSKTGIDIHPGATIGAGLCIDHGTGIVIGETTIIGRNVKLYQGVTLGALSVSKDLANKKRHPTIEDYVTVYANATILGGDTIIGKGAIIGGSVWLTESVPPNSKVFPARSGAAAQLP